MADHVPDGLALPNDGDGAGRHHAAGRGADAVDDRYPSGRERKRVITRAERDVAFGRAAKGAAEDADAREVG